LLALEEHFEFLLIGLLVHARNDTIQLLNQPCQVLEILLEKFIGDDFHVSNGVHIALIVHDLFIREGSHDMIDAIDGLNVGQEGVSETLTFTGTCNESRDIEDGDTSGDFRSWMVNFAKTLKSAVRHKDLGLRGINCAERIVFGGH